MIASPTFLWAAEWHPSGKVLDPGTWLSDEQAIVLGRYLRRVMARIKLFGCSLATTITAVPRPSAGVTSVARFSAKGRIDSSPCIPRRRCY